MQKFTVFSAILSLSIILVIGDLIFHDYLKKDDAAPVTEEILEELESTDETPTVVEEETETSLPAEELPVQPTELEEDEEPKDEITNEPVDLSSESIELEVLSPLMSEDLFIEAGFFDPTLKDTIYSGYVFQFLPYNDISAFTYQWNLFDGESYIGSIYEIKYPNETASFQGYLALRQAGSGQTDIGTVNEVNNYKDASFYFNHVTKSQTVHLVIKSGETIYAFEYAHRNHETMKNIFEGLL